MNTSVLFVTYFFFSLGGGGVKVFIQEKCITFTLLLDISQKKLAWGLSVP